MIIYHYTKAEYLESILEKGGVYLSFPRDFNDPYDCILLQDEEDKSNVCKLMKNYVMFVELFDTNIDEYYQNKIGEIDKTLLNQIREEIAKEELFIKEKQSYMFLNSLDKVASKIINSSKFLKTQYEELVREHNIAIQIIFNKIRNEMLVASFSKTKHSMLMWSHYSNKHQGVCLEYEVEEDGSFQDVEYSEHLLNVKLFNVISKLIGIKYLREHKLPFDDKYVLDNDILRPLFTKAIDWSYEKEVRFIKDMNVNDEKIIKIDDKFYLKMGNPKKIYMGSRIDRKAKKEVMKNAYKHHIKVGKMRMSARDFVIEEDYD